MGPLLTSVQGHLHMHDTRLLSALMLISTGPGVMHCGMSNAACIRLAPLQDQM